MAKDLGDFYVGYKASARVPELENSYPAMFERREQGKFAEHRIKVDAVGEWFPTLPKDLRQIVAKELDYYPHVPGNRFSPKEQVFYEEASDISEEALDEVDQTSMFDNVEEVEVAKETRRRMNAIKWLCAKGYAPMLGGLKNLNNFQLVNTDTREVETFNIDQVLSEYDQDRKDEARARAAAKRLEKGKNGIHPKKV
mgnify:CR=1 FL=1